MGHCENGCFTNKDKPLCTDCIKDRVGALLFSVGAVGYFVVCCIKAAL